MSESRSDNDPSVDELVVEPDAEFTRCVGSTALHGHEADDVSTSAVADEQNRGTSAHRGGSWLADPEETQVGQPNGQKAVSRGRMRVGDLIGWERVDELAAERAHNRKMAAALRSQMAGDGSAVLFSGSVQDADVDV